MFVSGVLYCNLNDSLSGRINRKRADNYTDTFKMMVGEDRVEATKLID